MATPRGSRGQPPRRAAQAGASASGTGRGRLPSAGRDPAASSNGVRTSHSTTSRAPPCPPASRHRRDRTGTAVRGGAAADPDETTSAHRPRPPRRSVHLVPTGGGGDRIPLGGRRARARSPPPSRRPRAPAAAGRRRPRSAARAGRGRGAVIRSSPSAGASAAKVPSPPSASGTPKPGGRGPPGRGRSPPPPRLVAASVPLNESGATRIVVGTSGIFHSRQYLRLIGAPRRPHRHPRAPGNCSIAATSRSRPASAEHHNA